MNIPEIGKRLYQEEQNGHQERVGEADRRKVEEY
jgi:hypothetical protein